MDDEAKLFCEPWLLLVHGFISHCDLLEQSEQELNKSSTVVIITAGIVTNFCKW